MRNIARGTGHLYVVEVTVDIVVQLRDRGLGGSGGYPPDAW